MSRVQTRAFCGSITGIIYSPHHSPLFLLTRWSLRNSTRLLTHLLQLQHLNYHGGTHIRQWRFHTVIVTSTLINDSASFCPNALDLECTSLIFSSWIIHLSHVPKIFSAIYFTSIFFFSLLLLVYFVVLDFFSEILYNNYFL